MNFLIDSALNNSKLHEEILKEDVELVLDFRKELECVIGLNLSRNDAEVTWTTNKFDKILKFPMRSSNAFRLSLTNNAIIYYIICIFYSILFAQNTSAF